MIGKKKIILTGLIVALGTSFIWSHNAKQEEKILNLEKTIDNQSNEVYNRDITIQELNRKLIEQQKVIDDLALLNDRLEEEREVQEVSRGGGREIDVEVTFYTHTGNPTASGTMPQVGKTAACNFLALGSHVVIDGHEYVIEDTGGMSGNVIDIFVDSEEEALQLGRRYTTARIL